MKVLITGAQGFLGKNLMAHLRERKDVQITTFTRDDALTKLPEMVKATDFVFHLAGVNRPQDDQDFIVGNSDLTRSLCESVEASGKQIPILFASSSQANQDNPYGNSKRIAEEFLKDLSSRHGSTTCLFRLPNIFGKWARLEYNSVVATFCHNISHDIPIRIDDPKSILNMVYIDDVVSRFISLLDDRTRPAGFYSVDPQYSITVGGLAEQLKLFRDGRENLLIEPVGSGLVRALYSTYLSYLPVSDFTYEIARHEDPRGRFVEMLKTRDSGQLSYFTSHPGVTRGSHYHHSKAEKFLVIKGRANFRFRQIESGEFFELQTDGDNPEIVETVPGWSHDITNIGEDEMLVMLWANEIFDRERPDTYAMPVVESI